MTECLLRRAAMAARQEDFDKAMELAKEATERRPDDVLTTQLLISATFL